MSRVIYGTVDEHGRCGGFAPTDLDDVGRYGDGLEGESVETDDGDAGKVTRVYSYIQTGNPGSGSANYVAVEITLDGDDDA